MKYINTTNRVPVWTFRDFNGADVPVYELMDNEISQQRWEKMQMAFEALNKGWSWEYEMQHLRELKEDIVKYMGFAANSEFELFVAKSLVKKEGHVITREDLSVAAIGLEAWRATKLSNAKAAGNAMEIVNRIITRKESEMVRFEPHLDLICMFFVTANEEINEYNPQMQAYKRQLIFQSFEGLELLKKKVEPKLLQNWQPLQLYFPNVFMAVVETMDKTTLQEILMKVQI